MSKINLALENENSGSHNFDQIIREMESIITTLQQSSTEASKAPSGRMDAIMDAIMALDEGDIDNNAWEALLDSKNKELDLKLEDILQIFVQNEKNNFAALVPEAKISYTTINGRECSIFFISQPLPPLEDSELEYVGKNPDHSLHYEMRCDGVVQFDFNIYFN